MIRRIPTIEERRRSVGTFSMEDEPRLIDKSIDEKTSSDKIASNDSKTYLNGSTFSKPDYIEVISPK